MGDVSDIKLIRTDTFLFFIKVYCWYIYILKAGNQHDTNGYNVETKYNIIKVNKLNQCNTNKTFQQNSKNEKQQMEF